ncbi:MAG TPA: transcriptional regulator, partial [Planctomycetaceae bacterium]|nr:transcriptional regulator [Planctomycetaceae bacterium]
MPHRSSQTAVSLVAAALAAVPSWGAAARGQAVAVEADRPGVVAGDARPDGDHAVRVDGGWMVAYDETIPGTDVTFRMIPVPGGTFRMGSP